MTNEITPTPSLSDLYSQLYRQAFEHFRVHALWNKHQLASPTPEDALVIASALRIEGNLEARFLAELIEQACRAGRSHRKMKSTFPRPSTT